MKLLSCYTVVSGLDGGGIARRLLSDELLQGGGLSGARISSFDGGCIARRTLPDLESRCPVCPLKVDVLFRV